MDEFNNKLLLKELAANKEALLLEIEKTEGYVLHNMEQSQVFPPIDFLLSPPNVLSLNFLIKNYKLDKDQFLLVNKMLSGGAKTASLISLSEAEIEEFLVNEILLPESVILSKELLDKYGLTKLLKQYDLDEYSTDRIVIKSLARLDVPTLLSLNKDFLIEHFSTLQDLKYNFSSDQYNQAFLDIAKPMLDKLHIRNFRYFAFENQHMPILKKLLRTNRNDFSSTSYATIEENPSIAKLVSKIDYLDYNEQDYLSFNQAELIANKEKIQETIYNYVSKKDRGLWASLIRLDMTVEGFKEVIDLPLLTKFLEGKKDYSMRQTYNDDSDSREKEAHLNQLAIIYTGQNPEKTVAEGKLDLSDNLYSIQKFLEKYDLQATDPFLPHIEKYYLDVIPLHFKTEHFDSRYLSLERLIKGRQFNFAKKLCETQPSVNLLYYLLSNIKEVSKNNSYSSEKSSLFELIEITSSFIEPKFRKQLFKYFNFQPKNEIVKYLKEKINPSAPAEQRPAALYNPMSAENNFLNYEGIELEKLNSITNIIYFSSDFRKHILKNRLSLPDDDLASLVYRLNEKDPQTLDFLEKYAALHLDEIKSSPDLLSRILAHPQGSRIIPPPSVEEEETSFKEIRTTIEKINVRSSIEAKKKLALKKKKPGSSDGEYYSDKEKSKLEQLLRTQTSALSFNFLGKKVFQLLKQKEFSVLKELSLHKEHNNLIHSFIENLKFEDLMANLKEPGFIEIFQSFKSKDDKPGLSFTKFSRPQNMQLSSALLPHYERPVDILYMFGNKDQQFVKSFAIEHCCHEIFYRYSLIYSSSLHTGETNLITSPYTPEEFLQIYLKLEEKEGLFGCVESNSHHYQFYRSNFEYNKENYLKTLELARPYPKLYLQLAHDQVLSYLEKKEDDYNNNHRVSLDEMCHKNFDKYIDIDIALEGAREVLHECVIAKKEYYEDEETPENLTRRIVNHDLAMGSIQKLIYNTFHRVPTNNGSGKDDYLSILSEEKIHKILSFLVNEAPYFLMSLYAVGPHANLHEHLINNFATYVDPTRSSKDVIDSILFPPREHRAERGSGFNTDQDGRFAHYIVGVVGGMINMYLAQGKMDEINYIIHVLEQADFISNSLDYDFKYKADRKNQEIVEFLNENKTIKELLAAPKSKILIDKVLDFKEEPVLNKSPKKSNRI